MLHANSDSGLLKALAKIDISRPTLLESLTKDWSERSGIARLLSTLVGKGYLSYPLNLHKRERPDFLLITDTHQIGIEHTKAIPQNEAKKDVLREQGNSPEGYFASHNLPGEPIKTKKTLLKEIEENRADDGWVGDSSEREWAQAMLNTINKKLTTLLKDGFESFDRDWLLICDNWNVPLLQHHEAASLLLKSVDGSGALDRFELIFIITGNDICEFSTKGLQFFEVNNMWD